MALICATTSPNHINHRSPRMLHLRPILHSLSESTLHSHSLPNPPSQRTHAPNVHHSSYTPHTLHHFNTHPNSPPHHLTIPHFQTLPLPIPSILPTHHCSTTAPSPALALHPTIACTTHHPNTRVPPQPTLFYLCQLRTPRFWLAWFLHIPPSPMHQSLTPNHPPYSKLHHPFHTTPLHLLLITLLPSSSQASATLSMTTMECSRELASMLPLLFHD